MKILFALHLFSHSRHFHAVIQRLVDRKDSVEIMALHKVDQWRTDLRVPPHLKGFKKRLTLLNAPRPSGDRLRGALNALRGARNYTIYGHWQLAATKVFRTRAAAFSPAPVRALFQPDGPLPGRWIAAASRWAERRIPADPVIVEAIRASAPDVVLVSPLIFNEMRELNDYVKAAQELGIPVGFPVFSWDNLTTKGTAQVLPDRIFVWNETQKTEAVELHGWPADRIDVLGAWRFDGFAEQPPRLTYDAFCKAYGLDPGRITITYLGSSPIVAPTEARFVVEWVNAIRASADPDLAGANLLIRPHPRNLKTWMETEGLASASGVAMQPVDANSLYDTDDLFEALHHSRAAVGLVTSAMLEAALLGRPVHTVMTSLAGEGQTGTAHFDYLTSVGGGLLHQAVDLDDHVGRLSESVKQAGPDVRSEAFVAAFIAAPNGRAPSLNLVEAIDVLARSRA